jgi:hypothetical protein
MRLISRNGYNRTELFQAPFERSAGLGREMVLDGEVAVPDNRGVTHVADVQEAIMRRQAERLAFFAFDRHDLRACRIKERKALLERVVKAAGCPRGIYRARGDCVEEARQPLLGGPCPDWLKAKVSQTGIFRVIGFKEIAPLRLEALIVADEKEARCARSARCGSASPAASSGPRSTRCGRARPITTG